MPNPPKPTLRTIAEITGFSQATISRVLANRMEVPETTRKAIHETASRLGYRGTHAHQGSQLGLLWSPIPSGAHGPFYHNLMESLLSQGEHEGIRVQLLSRNRLRQRAEDPFAFLRAQGIDLVVATAGDWGEHFMAPMLNRHFPVICLNRSPAPGDPTDIPWVYSDPFPATQKAIRHLRDLGHRKIHWFGDSQFINEALRREAFLSAGKMMGYGANQLPSHQIAGDDTVAAERAFHDLWIREKPTAVIACKLRLAIGILSACRNLKIRIPRDLTIITHDDFWFTDHMVPSLSTIGQNFDALAESVMRLARDLPLWPGVSRPIPTIFTLRESVGPPRKNGDPR